MRQTQQYITQDKHNLFQIPKRNHFLRNPKTQSFNNTFKLVKSSLFQNTKSFGASNHPLKKIST